MVEEKIDLQEKSKIRMINGSSFYLEENKLMLACKCGLKIKIPSQRETKIIKNDIQVEKEIIVYVVKKNVNDVKNGSFIIVTSNPNSHNYPLYKILIKIDFNRALYSDNLTLGNNLPNDVFEITKFSKEALKLVPTAFFHVAKRFVVKS